MNRRILKKACKRAMRVLIEKHGYSPEAFAPAEGDEAMCAPPRMERRFVREYLAGTGRWLHPGPLKGTPLLWRRTSHECDEWDCELPTERLREIEFWDGMSEEEFTRFCEAVLSPEPSIRAGS